MVLDRLARAFPLLLLTALAALAAWLNNATEIEALMPPRAHDRPDTILQDAHSVMYAPDGTKLYEIQSAEMQHIPEGDITLLKEVRIDQTPSGKPILHIKGDTAKLWDRGHQVELNGQVTLRRDDYPGIEPLEVATSNLQLDTLTSKANTSQPIRARTPSRDISSVGMDYDHEHSQLVLKSKVQITYEPAH
ncbi:LPS export ABC transporter periplasmic protein LptC [Burkholderiaceae bacterium DAT-1]|nr:LPS export ABC transporter periplasmic protein LptC [Burkholderiaceae bacterium DAT-1]